MSAKRTSEDCGGRKPLPLLKPKKNDTKKKQDKPAPKKKGK